MLNSGSSSLKYQLFDMETEQVLAKGLAERVGDTGQPGKLVHKSANNREKKLDVVIPDHNAALDFAFSSIADDTLDSISEIGAVGHRVVHGGESFTASVRIDASVLEKLDALCPLAPLHNPANIVGIRACIGHLPTVAQIAVFDTAFHATMKPVAYMYALPYELYESHQVRRYGFHGTSHSFVTKRAIKLLGDAGKTSRIVTCHLGNGCSMAAVSGGKVVDTTMGMTPAEGLVMGTRSGDIDPAILTFLMTSNGWSAQRVDSLINKEGGLLGLSGTSNDMRDIVDRSNQGDRRAKLAFDVFCHRIRKYIGAYAVEMGGLDAIVFTGGIGENSPDVRASCCETLSFMGCRVDSDANTTGKGERDISMGDSSVRVFVIPTNEELVIARETAELSQ